MQLVHLAQTWKYFESFLFYFFSVFYYIFYYIQKLILKHKRSRPAVAWWFAVAARGPNINHGITFCPRIHSVWASHLTSHLSEKDQCLCSVAWNRNNKCLHIQYDVASFNKCKFNRKCHTLLHPFSMDTCNKLFDRQSPRRRKTNGVREYHLWLEIRAKMSKCWGWSLLEQYGHSGGGAGLG